MKWFDELMERQARGLAQRTSRRGFLGRLATAVGGSALSLPLLPVARGADDEPVQLAADPGDPTSCDYWRYCAIDGFLCAACGGTQDSCPPGTEMAPITWIGTCQNPADKINYIISYNDCCGKSGCGAGNCNRNEGDRPIYRPYLNNEYNWCLGSESQFYNCSTARIVGTAL
jgi:methylamine dehydrogenase light chain